MDNNFAELISASITKSSELSAFPFTNAISKFRSRVWKPQGNFDITSSNKTLYIDDGSPLSADVTVQAYASPAALATEIQTQLNAVSANWTCTYDLSGGTYQFTIANSGSVTLRLSQTTTAIWDTIGYTTSSDIVGTSFVADQQRNHTSEFCIFDLAHNSAMTFFGVIGPLDSVFTLSTSATVKIQASNLNLFDSPPLDVTLTPTDAGILHFFDDITDTSYRFWKYSWVDKLNAGGPQGFEVGHIYLGDYVTLTDRTLQSGWSRSSIDPSRVSISESGVLHFDTKTKYTSFTGGGIAAMPKASKDLIDKHYNKVGKTTPFFVSFDPTKAVTDTQEELTKYVVYDREPVFTHLKGELFSVSLEFREVV